MVNALETLTNLPFVSDLESSKNGSTRQVRLHTPEGTFDLAAVTVPRRAGAATIDQAMNWMSDRGVEQTILLSPGLSRPTIRKLLAGGYNFADEQGNCHVALDGRFVATIVDFEIAKADPADEMAIHESVVTVLRRAPGTPRAPGHQVLFALLARPELLRSTLRETATAAGVSTQPVIHMLEYLSAAAWIEGRRRSRRWSPNGRSAAVDMWVRGYAERVRTRMRPRVFRTPHDDPASLQHRLAAVLTTPDDWKWHGETAAHRLLPHYASVLTCILASGDLESHLKEVPAMPARQGNLIVMNSFSPLCLEGATPDTAHPFLIYAELSSSPDPRSQETARLLLGEGLVK